MRTQSCSVDRPQDEGAKRLPKPLLSHQVEVGRVVGLPFALVSIQVAPADIVGQYDDEVGLLHTGSMSGRRVEQQTTHQHQHPGQEKRG